MTNKATARPYAFVAASDELPGTVFDVETGEVVADRKTLRLVRGLTRSVVHTVGVGFPDRRFRLTANRHGRIVSAASGILLQASDVAFPGCANVDEVEAAHCALNGAGATRGNSPAGRALDYALRTSKDLAQWRAPREAMSVFSQSLYGGVQFGGTKPSRARGRVALDIVSSYPYQATRPLPRIREAIVERGLRRGAALIQIEGRQSGPALFSRDDQGTTTYSENISGWYPAEEVDYHVSAGRVRVNKVVSSCTFTHWQPYLAPAIEHLFTHRERYARGSAERSVLKSALNGLLGKLASPISAWRTPSQNEMRYTGARNVLTLSVGKSSLLYDPKLVGIYPRHCSLVWTAITYARARVALWQKVDEITRSGGKCLWIHTDCIVADVPESFAMRSGNGLGEWRLVE